MAEGRLGFKKLKMLVVSRANARQDDDVYFQNLDGSYLDGIAEAFKETEILAPIHIKGIHPTYEIYKDYTYRFKAANAFITDMAGVKSYSNNIFKHISRLISEMYILNKKVKSSDFVYVFMSTFKAAMAVWLCLRYRKPFAVYLGNDWHECAKFQYRWQNGPLKLGKYPFIALCTFLEGWVMRNSPAKIINSPKLYNKYKHFPGRTEETMPLIPLKPFAYFWREDTCSGGVIKILTVASIISLKGLEYLLEGFYGAQRKVPNLELHLLGTGGDKAYKEKLQDIVSAGNLGSRVYWHGYIPNSPELFKYYRDSDIFVLPSLSEGFPRVIWEAMFQSLPVITTRLETIYDKLGRHNVAHFVPPRDSKAIADGLIKILKEGEYRRSLIKNGFTYVREVLREEPAQQFIRFINSGQIWQGLR